MELGDFVKILDGTYSNLGVGKIISATEDGACVVAYFDKPNAPSTKGRHNT